ncbi:hypothetical protein FPV67DRAFT_1423318, partial [Lyophyllum atratum]
SGFIYTDANGGVQDGTETTRAEFRSTDDYYYIVIDPAYFNVGVQNNTLGPCTRAGNFCIPASCTTLTCPSAFQQPSMGFPAPASTPLKAPLFPMPSTGNWVESRFRPDGSFPTPPTVTLHPNDNAAKCLDVRGAVCADGTAVQIMINYCNSTAAQKWQFRQGMTKVRVSATNSCSDAGSDTTAPASGMATKMWTCCDNLAAQSWYYTIDTRLALNNAGAFRFFCMGTARADL